MGHEYGGASRPGVELDASRGAVARVMPLAFITYSLAYLDRQNYSLAEAAGMNQTLHVGPAIGSLLPSLFFLGYCLFRDTRRRYAAHRSAKRLIFWALVLWGVLSALTGIVVNVPALIAARVLLGVVEGVVFPALLVYLTHWFTKREKSRANTLLILANPITMLWMSVASGFLIRYFDHHRVLNVAGWRMMFILEGIPSIAWAVVWLWLADDRPTDANGWPPMKQPPCRSGSTPSSRGSPASTITGPRSATGGSCCCASRTSAGAMGATG